MIILVRNIFVVLKPSLVLARVWKKNRNTHPIVKYKEMKNIYRKFTESVHLYSYTEMTKILNIHFTVRAE